MYAIQFGMSYEQYWKGDAELYWAYQVAFENKIKFEQEIENNISWLRGLYMYQAYSAVQYNLNRQKHEQPMNYLDKPIDFEEEKRKQTRENKQRLFEEHMKAILHSKKILLEKRKKEQ